MADIFDVVADPTRRDVLHLLLTAHRASIASQREMSVGEMVERLGLTQPTVSKHLRVLRDHGLVSVREDGQHRYYRLDPTPLTGIEAWVTPYLGRGPVGTVGNTPFSSLPGHAAGDRVGRVVAERTLKARRAVEDARAQVSRGINRLNGR
jgi:ArsR family transcriptional regulator